MMLDIIAYLSLLVCSAGAFEIKQVDSDGAHLIETSLSNYALASPNIMQNGWKTVSRNGDQVSIIAPDCQVTLKSSQSLSESEGDVLDNVKDKLSNVANIQGSQVSYELSRFSTEGSVLQQKSRGINIDRPDFSTNIGPVSITKSGDDYSISKPGLPMNLARVFAKDDVVTFVYLDGQVKMKPSGCLEPSEQQLIEQLQLEVQQAEEQSKSRKNDSPRKRMYGDSKYNMQINYNPLNMLKNLDNIFAPTIPKPVLNPLVDYEHPQYHPLSGPGLNPLDMIHRPAQPPYWAIHGLGPVVAPPPYHGGSFDEISRDALNTYNPIRTYNNLQMGDVDRGFHWV